MKTRGTREGVINLVTFPDGKIEYSWEVSIPTISRVSVINIEKQWLIKDMDSKGNLRLFPLDLIHDRLVFHMVSSIGSTITGEQQKEQ